MITDIFALRYEGVLSFDLVSTHGVTATLVQAAHIFFDDVRPKLGLRDDFFSDVHRQLARELGSVKLWDARSRAVVLTTLRDGMTYSLTTPQTSSASPV